jgi:predicted acyltransferase
MLGWTWNVLNVHLGWIMESRPVDAMVHLVFGSDGFNPIYMPIIERLSVVFVFWLICLWMYRQKIFVRI